MENLKFGFIMWLWSCAATIVVFVGELMIWFVLIRAKSMLNKFIRKEWSKISDIYPVKVKKSSTKPSVQE